MPTTPNPTVEKLLNKIVKGRHFEDRLEYTAEDLSRMYNLTPYDAHALRVRLHEEAAK